jgi:hypothetical protein
MLSASPAIAAHGAVDAEERDGVHSPAHAGRLRHGQPTPMVRWTPSVQPTQSTEEQFTGAILVLAAAVFPVGEGIAEAIFRQTLLTNGGSPFFFFPDYANAGAWRDVPRRRLDEMASVRPALHVSLWA